MATLLVSVCSHVGLKDESEKQLIDLKRELRGVRDSMNAPGLISYGNEYMPFASGTCIPVRLLYLWRVSETETNLDF